jgi:SH3 domain-containing YSC84-like protein 1
MFEFPGVAKSEVLIMKKTALAALVSVAITFPALAQNKIDDRLGNSAEVLKQILSKPD